MVCELHLNKEKKTAQSILGGPEQLNSDVNLRINHHTGTKKPGQQFS